MYQSIQQILQAVSTGELTAEQADAQIERLLQGQGQAEAQGAEAQPEEAPQAARTRQTASSRAARGRQEFRFITILPSVR